MEAWYKAALIVAVVCGLVGVFPAYRQAQDVWEQMKESNSAAPTSDLNSGMAMVMAPFFVWVLITAMFALSGFGLTMIIGLLVVA